MVFELSRSLAEQPPSTASLLEQPARPASLVVPPPVMSLGPEQVTDQVRAEERAEERARRQAEEPHAVSAKRKTPAPKKRKTIPPELEDRQQRASARMKTLGVPLLEVRLDFLLLKLKHVLYLLITYCFNYCAALLYIVFYIQNFCLSFTFL